MLQCFYCYVKFLHFIHQLVNDYVCLNVLLRANNKGTDQPAHPCRLVSAFVIRFLQSRIFPLGSCHHLNILGSFCSLAGWFEYDLVRNPEDRFS